MVFITKFWQIFLDYTKEVLPYFFLALLFTTFLKIYMRPGLLVRVLRSSQLAPLFSSLLASILPVCSCSVIPLAIFINNLSRTFAPTLSFLMIAPVISPVTFLLTLGMLKTKFALFRVLITLIFANLLSFLSIYLFKKEERVIAIPEVASHEKRDWRAFLREFTCEGLAIGKYVLLGLLLASLLVALLPSDKITMLSKFSFSYFLIALVSVPIYVCSGEEVPIARALIDLGLTPGQAMVFLLASSGICLPTIMAALRFLPLKIVLYYVAGWFLMAITAGYIYDYLTFFNN